MCLCGPCLSIPGRLSWICDWIETSVTCTYCHLILQSVGKEQPYCSRIRKQKLHLLFQGSVFRIFHKHQKMQSFPLIPNAQCDAFSLTFKILAIAKPSTREVETRKSLWVWGQPGLQSEFLNSQTTQRNLVLKNQTKTPTPCSLHEYHS